MRRQFPTLERQLGPRRAWFVGLLQAAILVAGAGVFGLVFAGLYEAAVAAAGAR